MGLRRDIELETYRLCHDALFWAHLGQALDLGFKTDSFDQGSVSGYAKISMQLKTGALTALASELGAIVAGAKESVREAIREFGRNFGIILQSCNDLSEFSKHPIKVSRDLLLDRPTWVLAAAAESLSKSEYKDFQQQVDKLRNLGEVEALVLMKEIKNHKAIKEAQASAKQFLQASFETLKLKLDEHNSGATSSSHWRELEVLGQTMLETYGF
jgi:geranylgeranyl pyrophosphate synthase